MRRNGDWRNNDISEEDDRREGNFDRMEHKKPRRSMSFDDDEDNFRRERRHNDDYFESRRNVMRNKSNYGRGDRFDFGKFERRGQFSLDRRDDNRFNLEGQRNWSNGRNFERRPDFTENDFENKNFERKQFSQEDEKRPFQFTNFSEQRLQN